MNEVQAEKRNQKTMGPTAVGQPSTDDLAYFNTKEITNQSADDKHFDIMLRLKPMPTNGIRHHDSLGLIVHIESFNRLTISHMEMTWERRKLDSLDNRRGDFVDHRSTF